MGARKKLQELTFKNNFMFGAVMTDPQHCRDFLELTLGFPIERVEVDKEKSLVYHPEYKGVRLDVYAKDKENTHYNVEMQVLPKPELRRRVRYYHSQIDMELLLSGQDYVELPDSYVIFICDFDPFGEEKYCYTFETMCREDISLALYDGNHSIFLSTCGKNDSEVSEALVKFLKFVKADDSESTKDFEDAFVGRLQDAVRHIKESREMEERYMILEEMLRDERAEGRAEGKAEGMAEAVLELLEDIGSIPNDLKEKILSSSDLELLRRWHKLAAKAESIEQFIKELQ